MKLIFIWGPAASGKLTVARALGELTGLPVFHNHLVVDALLERLEFGEPEFVRLREAMWMAGFETAAKERRSLIFTFAPEPTVEPGFTARVETMLAQRGGEVKYVRLLVSRETQEARIGEGSRRQFRKLVSVDMLRELRPSFAASEAEMPAGNLVIDTELDAQDVAAMQIAAAFGLDKRLS